MTRLADTEEVYLEWRRLIVEHGIKGTKVHDARLAAAMYVHRVLACSPSTRAISGDSRDLRFFTRPISANSPHIADIRSYSALNSQPRIAIAAIRYIHTSSAMLVPMLPYITL